MLESLRQLWKRRPKPLDLAPMRAWAKARGYELRTVRDGEGCLIEPNAAHPAWRIEWGESQRSYIPGRELRIIGEVGTPKELVAMLLARPLQETMEKLVFEQYVEDVQTRLDTETPPEMRWLVLYAKLPSSEMGHLRERYAVVGNVKSWLSQWLGGALNDALTATLESTDGADPMVLTIARGRMTLRTAMQMADDRLMTTWLSVFEHALHEAQRLSAVWLDSIDASHSTQPAAWPRSALPEDRSA